MKSSVFAVAAIAAFAATACSTKSYPIATDLTDAEIALMDCRELEREMIRADNVREQISDTANLNWRSAAGFMGDFGIGNAMARGDAERAVNARVTSIRNAQASKGCATSA